MAKQAGVLTEFVDYVMSFYGPKGLYKEFFKQPLKRAEVEKALVKRLSETTVRFDGDSIDRERVRDILTEQRGGTPGRMVKV